MNKMARKPKELSVGQVWEDRPFLKNAYIQRAQIASISWTPAGGGYTVESYVYAVGEKEKHRLEILEISAFCSKYPKYIGLFNQIR